MSSTDDADLHQTTQKSNPLPTILPILMTPPMLLALKTKLAKMEDELYPKMEQYLEALLGQLESNSTVHDFDMDRVIESLSSLNNILGLAERLFHTYERFMNYDRIVLLCAKQYDFVYNTYVDIPESEVKNPEDLKSAQRLLDITTVMLTSFFLGDNLKDYQYPRETLRYLVQSIFNYLLLWWGSHQATFTVRGIDGSAIYKMMKNILCGPNAPRNAQPKVISPLRIDLLTVVLREFYSIIVDRMQLETDEYSQQEFNMAINVLSYMIDCKHCVAFYFSPDTKNLSEFIYEIYCMYGLCCQLDEDGPYQECSLLPVMSSIQLYIMSLCTNLNERIWMHFELVDKEILDLKIDPEEVELFKFMAICGFTRVVEPKNILSIPESNSIEIHQSESNLTIPSIPGIDSNVSILDLEEHHDDHPILEPTKIALKPAETPNSESEIEEDELVKSFEVLNVSEPEVPEGVTPIENLSNQQEVLKIQQDMFKSEQMLNELAQMLVNQTIHSTKDQ